jgi:hypothetical protein
LLESPLIYLLLLRWCAPPTVPLQPRSSEDGPDGTHRTRPGWSRWRLRERMAAARFDN